MMRTAVLLLCALCCAAVPVCAYEIRYADGDRDRPVKWANERIKVSISRSLLRESWANRDPGAALVSVIRSITEWEAASGVRFELVLSDEESISPEGEKGDGVSLITVAATPENLLLFNGDGSEASAYTRVFYDESGTVTEADIVLNPYARFVTDGSFGAFDLQSTLVHEMGHFLGLGHSDVLNSVMNPNNARNGLFGIPFHQLRNISDDDKAGIRDLYGPGENTPECCGSVVGIVEAGGKSRVDGLRVWAEFARTGRLAAATRTETDGGFRFSSLEQGEYDFFLSSSGGTVYRIGEGSVAPGSEPVELFAETGSPTERESELLVGLNGQLSSQALPLDRANSYLVSVGGKGITGKHTFEMGAPGLTVRTETMRFSDYGNGIGVLQAVVEVDESVASGGYTIAVRGSKGGSAVILGAVAVGEDRNPWSHGRLP